MMKNLSLRDWEALSAYLDDQLSRKQRARLEGRLQKNPELKAGLDELRSTMAVLQSQPRLRAPRNFMLTPDMVGQPRSRRVYPAVRLAAVLASIMFIVTFFGDIFFVGGLGGELQVARAPQSDAAIMAVPVEKHDEPLAEMMLDEAEEFSLESAEMENRALTEEVEQTRTEAATQIGTIITEQESVAEEGAGEPMAAAPLFPTIAGTPQPAFDVYGLQATATPTDLASPTATMTESPTTTATPAAVFQNTPVPVGISQLVSGIPVIRVLEILVAILAVGMWVSVWFLRRR
jgi:hypothetical protein